MEKGKERKKKEKEKKRERGATISLTTLQWTEEGKSRMEWVARAVSPDGDGSHLHPLTRCKSVSCIFTRTESGNNSDFPISPIPCVRPLPSAEDDVPRTSSPPSRVAMGLLVRSLHTEYKRISNCCGCPVSDHVSCHLPSTQNIQTRSMARTPAHPKSSSIIPTTPLHACAFYLTCALLIQLSFYGSFCIFPIEAPWNPGLP